MNEPNPVWEAIKNLIGQAWAVVLILIVVIAISLLLFAGIGNVRDWIRNDNGDPGSQQIETPTPLPPSPEGVYLDGAG